MAEPNVVVGNISELTMLYRVAGQTCMTVRHYRCDNLPTDPTYSFSRDLFFNFLSEPVTGLADKASLCMNEQAEIYGGRWQIIKPTRYYYFDFAFSYPGNIEVGGPMPPNVAATISLQSTRAGRGRTGSCHLGGLDKSATTDLGVLDPALVTSLNAVGTLLLKNVGGAVDAPYWSPVTFNYRSGEYAYIQGFRVQSTARVMRRRTVGVGI